MKNTDAQSGRPVFVWFIAMVLLVPSEADHVSTTAADTQSAVELLALDQATEDRVLAITGSVHNPNGAVPVDQLSVVAMAFSKAGRLVASDRSSVELPSLSPGAALPFAVEVPAAGLCRYRISFLIDDVTIPRDNRMVMLQADTAGESSR